MLLEDIARHCNNDNFFNDNTKGRYCISRSNGQSKVRGKYSTNNLIDVNISALKPANLFYINIQFEGVPAKALIDTGASHNFVKKRIVKDSVAVNRDINVNIKGLGKNGFTTEGTTNSCIEIANYQYRGNFFVTSNDILDDDVDVVLGLEFLQLYKCTVDVKSKTMITITPDRSKLIFCSDADGNIDTIIERLPVFACKTIGLNNDISKVPFKVNAAVGDHQSLVFESKIKNKNFTGIDGIIDRTQIDTNNFVFVSRDKGTTAKGKIKAGEMIGEVSTLIEVDKVVSESLSRENLLKLINIGKIGDDDKHKFVEMISNIREVFSEGKTEVGQAKVTPHRIELNNYSPIWQRPRRFAEPVNKEVEDQCADLLRLNVIENSKSRWSSPVVPVRKSNGELRLCVDYRKVNSVTKTEKFPMPNLTDSIYSARGAKVFTKLDLVKGYYQIPLDEESREFTAFSTPHNHYQFKTLSFGMKNSGIYFQRTMQEVLSEFCFSNVVVYIDDVLIMTETIDENIELTRKVLNTLRINGFKVNINKCEFAKYEIDFLGHVLTCNGIKKSPKYVDRVKEYPKPKNITEMRRFLGFVNFQGKFVKNLSSLTKPLSSVTGGPKKKIITWTDEMNESFDALRRELTKDLTLSYPDYSDNSNPLELSVDASNFAAGACLQQIQNNVCKTIAYASITFSTAQTRYSTIERELCAIRWGIKIFRPFLFGVKFKLYTDHKPLLYLQNMSHENSRLMRTITELAEYDFSIEYRPGVDNVAADTMSRLVDGTGMTDLNSNNDFLPRGLKLLTEIPGGGDSFFETIIVLLNLSKEKLSCKIPDDITGLRKIVVDYIIDNSKTLGLNLNKEIKKRVLLIKQTGQLPTEFVFSAVCNIFSVELWFYHGMTCPVIYKSKTSQVGGNSCILHIQCKSGIHFNPLLNCNDDRNLVNLIDAKNINCHSREPNHNNNKLSLLNNQSEYGDNVDDIKAPSQRCNFCKGWNNCTVIEISGARCCAIIDTGAQVSLISDTVFSTLTPNAYKFIASTEGLIGMNREKTHILGIAEIKIKISEVEINEPVTFAIVEQSNLPGCCLLGSNFLSSNALSLDYDQNNIIWNDSKARVPLKTFHIPNTAFSLTCIENVDEFPDEHFKVRYKMLDYIVDLQDRDHAIRNLKSKVSRGVSPNLWQTPCINKFKFCHKELFVTDGILVRRIKNRCVAVLPFSLLIEAVYKTHCGVAHVGRHKLVNLVSEHFWHPALDKVARDVCTTCAHCQFHKVSTQHITPPVVKIASDYPFHLVAMDLVSFERSSSGFNTILVVVDHFSKFAAAVPLKDKKAQTVCNAILNRVLPYLLKIPSRILTDNGPEFRSDMFNELLNSFNIAHVHSTRYRAEGNGAVERCNRSITELLKGLYSHSNDWDIKLPRAIIAYNNTYHSEIKESPNSMLLNNSVKVVPNLPLKSSIVDKWKPGHPRFAPFKLKQKVLLKIQKIGNCLKYKLGKKFDGPFEITKIKSNNVSYDVQLCNGSSGKVIKAHHTQLKAWKEPLAYLRKYINTVDEDYDTLHNDDDFDNVPCVTGWEVSSSEEVSVSEVSESNSEETVCSNDRSPSAVFSVHSDDDREVMIYPSLNVSKIGNTRLEDLPCSESIVMENNSHRQSTPINDKLGDFKDRMDEMDQILDDLDKSISMYKRLELSMDGVFDSISCILEGDAVILTNGRARSENVSVNSNDEDRKNSYSGIGLRSLFTNSSSTSENANFDAEESGSKNILNDIKSIISQAKSDIAESRRKSKNFVLDLHRYRESRRKDSLFSTVENNSGISSIESFAPRNLRSRGPVPDLPYVQEKTLEYRLRTAK